MKEKIICPNCSNEVFLKNNCYNCSNCGWNSKINTLDISYKDENSAVLSNLFPNKFEVDRITCLSMESFLQSLREPNPTLRTIICSEYNGYMAYKMRRMLTDWRQTGIVYWQGKKIIRNSEDYHNLLKHAYSCLYNDNLLFRTVLIRTKGKFLIHSIGCDDKKETLLTESEYRYFLNFLLHSR